MSTCLIKALPKTVASEVVVGSPDSLVNNLDLIPSGSCGTVYLGTSVRPNSNVGTYPYLCYGAGGFRILFVNLTTTSETLYYCVRTDTGTLRAWKTVTVS